MCICVRYILYRYCMYVCTYTCIFHLPQSVFLCNMFVSVRICIQLLWQKQNIRGIDMVGVHLPLIEKKPRATGFWADMRLHSHQGPYFISFCFGNFNMCFHFQFSSSIYTSAGATATLFELWTRSRRKREGSVSFLSPPRAFHLVLIYSRLLGSEVYRQDTPPILIYDSVL